MINPALTTFPEEASIIGHLVVGYGELDITMVAAAGHAIDMKFELLDALEEVYSERSRIEIIRKMATPAFQKVGLGDQFDIALRAMNECREVRNYFAHCHYGYFHHEGGLLSVKARDLFSQGDRRPENLPWRHLTTETLQRQEKYFEATRAWWLWLDLTLPFARKGETSAFALPRTLPIPERDAGPYIHSDEIRPFWEKPKNSGRTNDAR